MKIRLDSSLTLATLTSLALGLSACAMQEDSFDDAQVIAAALETDNGGLDMEDEAPLFGDEALFAEADEADAGVPVDDTIEADPAVIEMLGSADAVLYHVTAMWGQIPGDRDSATAYNWSGTISVNRGAIIVRGVLAFDGVDRLTDRNDPRVVAFRSATLPHRDGLRLTVVDPEPGAAEPLVITYRSVAGVEFSATMDELLAEPQSLAVDDAGNRIVVVALRQPVDVCGHGFLGGRWHKVAEHRGRILGRVATGEGELLGHVRGLYGQRDSGERVFFAKYIDRDGRFRGILAGTYEGGHFAGRWLTRDGDRGAARGEYRETEPGLRIGGHFLGRWAETSCNLDL